MAGAVRTALVLRMGILKGLNYNVYYTLNSDSVWEKATYKSGYGYGMIDCNSRHTAQAYDRPWYPYYAQKFIGENLALDDPILETICDSNDIRVLAWQHNSTLNILLICEVKENRTVHLSGVSGQLRFFKIDDTVPYTSPSVQEGIINPNDSIIINGYTVILLQSSI
jgi:hypothetical protein